MDDILDEAHEFVAVMGSSVVYRSASPRTLASGPRIVDGLLTEIAQLRADLARVTTERDEAIEDRKAARDDAARAAALLAVRTMERDARPAISREDAALTSCSLVHRIGYAQAEWDACLRIENALRAHAAGSGEGGDDG